MDCLCHNTIMHVLRYGKDLTKSARGCWNTLSDKGYQLVPIQQVDKQTETGLFLCLNQRGMSSSSLEICLIKGVHWRVVPHWKEVDTGTMRSLGLRS